MLELGWYYSVPLDFEHKQWLLFAYLRDVDEAFASKVFSPYLLHTEMLVDDMEVSLQHIRSFEKSITKKSVLMSFEALHLIETPPTRPEEFRTIIEIVEFSVPLLKNRVNTGKQLHNKFKGLIY